MALASANRANLMLLFLPGGGQGKLSCKNTGWYSDDAITDEHDYARHELAEWCRRGDITISHRCDGDNCPVDTGGDTLEAVLPALDEMHEGTQYDNNREYNQHENGDLPQAPPDGYQEKLHLAHEMRQAENAEYPQKAKRPENEQGLGTRIEQTQVTRNDSQQIHQAEETEHVPPGLMKGQEAQDELNGKNDGKSPFQRMKKIAIARTIGRNAV